MEFEKLGAFYLGREVVEGRATEAPLLYDARDLTTHAVCIGMTGSGKTGLCVDLLEEAALDRVPAIVVDPKGDITNLLLTFPELAPEDFRPWVNPDDARREGVDLDTYAAAQADLWREGLARWGQSGDRIRALRDTTDFTIYTPGSQAGVPVSVLGSFDAPDVEWDRDAEHLRERVSGIVSGLLGLVGVDADPVQSREHILLAHLFEHHWRAGRDLDLATLILSIQDPPVRRLGVFDLDTFFPDKDRTELAMRLNALVAAPAFGSWLEGQRLDIPSFLATPEGRPRHSIFYVAHLSEAERMFFVTLLLNQVVAWMRTQSGTTSLRALLYMDEVFGFLPPVAEPPSKRPFLTLLKQARAYGLGLALTTQNPVDLDYKALTNAGTWFLGRLQTERDKARVLEGLEAASAAGGEAPGRDALAALISGLDKRVFLLHNVHEGVPTTFRTRWAMSYLRGPLTRDQVARLMADREPDAAARSEPPTPPDRPPEPDAGPALVQKGPGGRRGELHAAPPALDSGIRQVFLPVELDDDDAAREAERSLGAEPSLRNGVEIAEAILVYEPAVLGVGAVHYLHKKSGAEHSEEVALLARPDARGSVRWSEASIVGARPDTWADEPRPGARFSVLPQTLNEEKELRDAARDLADFLYRTRRITLYHSPDVDAFSEPGESAREFRLRLGQAARERRDEEVDAIEARHERELAKLGERLRRARARLEQREAEADARQRETLVSIGESVLGLFLGRRSTRTASSSLRKMRMSSSAKSRAAEAEEDVGALEARLAELEAELAAEVADVTARWEASALELEEVAVTPRRADVDVDFAALAWTPHWRLRAATAAGERLVSVPATS